eukprot:550511_1
MFSKLALFLLIVSMLLNISNLCFICLNVYTLGLDAIQQTLLSADIVWVVLESISLSLKLIFVCDITEWGPCCNGILPKVNVAHGMRHYTRHLKVHSGNDPNDKQSEFDPTPSRVDPADFYVDYIGQSIAG